MSDVNGSFVAVIGVPRPIIIRYAGAVMSRANSLTASAWSLPFDGDRDDDLDAGYPDGGTWQQRKSELLFPSAEGKLLCRSAIQKPFAKVTEACGLGKSITPRAMRRTFQDLTRKAGVDGVVAMAISGHATDASRIRCSTANAPEVAKAIGKVVSIATAQPRPGKRRKAGYIDRPERMTLARLPIECAVLLAAEMMLE